MRKIKNSIFTLLLFTLAVQVQAQDKGTMRASLGALYASQIEEVGMNIGGEYFITSKVSAAPSYTNYLLEGEGDLSQINLDARYYLLKGPVQVYALGGYTSLRASAGAGGFRIALSDRGVNLGAGVVIPLPVRLGINSQLKYSTPGDGQVMMQAGLTYTFK